jgi:hypothetical protein
MTNFLHMIEKGRTKVPVHLLEIGGSLSPESGGIVSGPGGSAVVTPSGGTAPSQPRTAAPLLGSVPVSPLLATTSPLPAAYQGLGQSGSLESLSPEEVNDMVATILKRKRL